MGTYKKVDVYIYWHLDTSSLIVTNQDWLVLSLYLKLFSDTSCRGTPEAPTRTFAITHAPQLEKLQRICKTSDLPLKFFWLVFLILLLLMPRSLHALHSDLSAKPLSPLQWACTMHAPPPFTFSTWLRHKQMHPSLNPPGQLLRRGVPLHLHKGSASASPQP